MNSYRPRLLILDQEGEGESVITNFTNMKNTHEFVFLENLNPFLIPISIPALLNAVLLMN